jgi:hypothetical protein
MHATAKSEVRIRKLLGGPQGHFFGFALYLDRSRDARPLPRGLTGHVAHPLRSILHRDLLCAAAPVAKFLPTIRTCDAMTA